MFARSIIRRSAQQIGCSATSTVPAEHVEILRRDPNPKIVAAIVLGSLASYWVLCKKDEQTNGGPSYWAGKLFLNHGNFSFQPRTMNALYAKLGQN